MADISSTINHQKDIDILNSLLTDVTMLRSTYNTLATKLNADTGVADVDYAQAAALVTTL